MAARVPSIGADPGDARATTRRPATARVPGRNAALAGSAIVTLQRTALRARASDAATSVRARIGRWVLAGSYRAGPASADAASVGAARAVVVRAPAVRHQGVSEPAAPELVDLAPARLGPEAAPGKTIVVDPGGIATTATVDRSRHVTAIKTIGVRRSAVTATTVIVARPAGVLRSPRGATRVTRMLPLPVARGRPATSCTGATPSSRRSGPAGRSAG